MQGILVHFENSINQLINNGWLASGVIALGIILLAVLFKRLVVKLVFYVLKKLLKNKHMEWYTLLKESFKKPMEYFILFTGFYWAYLSMPFSKELDLQMATLFKALFVALIAFGVFKMEGLYEHLFTNLGEKLNVKRSNLLKQFVGKVFKVAVVVLAGVLILDLYGFDISTFIAGLGLAGLALALAAQDTLQNVFAGITIIFDKPFDVGDRVLTNNIDGIVEDINFRSTRIRTLEMEFVTIPNSNIANQAILNFTKRDQRKVKMSIGCMYQTTGQQLKAVVGQIKDLLKADQDVNQESINVCLEGFGASSINILVMYLTNTSDWNQYLIIRERINYRIMEIMAAEEVAFAFPSQSLYFETPLHISHQEGKETS